FEANLRDERFLPFEGAGAESTWKLELPSNYPAFDYATISDVILHFRYTARLGIEPSKVKAARDDLFQQAGSNLALLFSLRHDVSTEWSAFVSGTADFKATIRRDHFPYFTQGKEITITGLELYGTDGNNLPKHHIIGNQAAWDSATTDLKDPSKLAFTVPAPEDTSEPKVLTRTASAEVFLIVRYTLAT